MEDRDILNIINKELDTLVSKMCLGDVQYSCDITDGEEGVKNFKITFEGEDLGCMIGSRGRHLDSFQFIIQIILGRLIEDDFRVFVDVGGYRKERDEKIEKFALQKADDARILGEAISLAPMKPYDRRVVHMTLQKFDDIKTESVGEGMDRYIIITPLKEEDLGIDMNSSEEDEESEE